MRISDWSSDVCSSDLWADLDDIDPDAVPQADEELPKLRVDHGDRQEPIVIGALIVGNDDGDRAERHMIAGMGAGNCRACQRREQQNWHRDRTSAVEGKSGEGRVDLGGHRSIRKKKKKKTRNQKDHK